jgi:transposase
MLESLPVPHLQGTDRHEVILFPPSLDDSSTPDNPVRCINAVVDHLNVQTLGLTRSVAACIGRPAYHRPSH